jgi:K+-transporting ATPase A subunit
MMGYITVLASLLIIAAVILVNFLELLPMFDLGDIASHYDMS